MVIEDYFVKKPMHLNKNTISEMISTHCDNAYKTSAVVHGIR